MGSEEQFFLLSLGIAIILIRIGVRWKHIKHGGWQLDDYLMPCTGVLFAAETMAAHLAITQFDGLTNSYMTNEERANIDINSREYYNRVWGSKIQVIGWSLYACILWSLKFCITVFYGRLTSGLTRFRTRMRIAYIMLAVTYTAVALTILLSCQPFSHFWQVSPNPGILCQSTNSPVNILVVMIPNILTDTYLLLIPLCLVWGVNISLRQRLTLVVLFSGALFIIMAGTIRAVTIFAAGPNGAALSSAWACRETFVAIIVTNLPIIQPLLRKVANKISLGVLFSEDTKSASRSNCRRGHELVGSHLATDHRQRPSSDPLSTTPNAPAWCSNEHILFETKNGNLTTHESGSSSRGITIMHEISVHSQTTTEAHLDDTIEYLAADAWRCDVLAAKSHS